MIGKNNRDELMRQLASYAYWKGEPRQLSSGRLSNEYVDCRSALSRPEVLNNLAPVVWGLVHDSAEFIGGMTMGADPIAISTSIYTAYSDRKIGWFSVRKEPKQHGTQRRIEGSLQPGATVVVVEDVVTTGASTIQAIQACREYGLDVVQVIVLVDRQEDDGLEKIAEIAQFNPDVIASMREISALWGRW